MNNSSTQATKTAGGFDVMLRLQTDAHLRNFVVSMMVINAVSSFMASILNFLIILTIVKTPSLRTTSNILILSLAISDLSVGFVVQPTYCSLGFALLTINLSLRIISAKIFIAVCPILSWASLLTVTAITIDRFLAIRLHLRYQELVRTKRSCIVAITIWIVSLSWGVVCYLVKHRAVVMIDLILNLFVILLTIFLMLKISQVVRRHSAEIQVQQQSAQPTINMQRYKKSFKTMYYIIGAFVACYCPYFFHYIGRFAVGKVQIALFVTGALTITLVMLNSVVNPVIYFLRIQEMRNAVLQLLRRFWCH